MPTKSEVDALKAANAAGGESVAALILKWESELFTREMAKSGAVSFKLHALRGGAVKDVVGKLVAPDLAFHKDAWGGAHWVLTHIPSEIAVLSGKRGNCAAATKEFISRPWLGTLSALMVEHKFEALKHVGQDIIQDYRKLYEAARGM